MSALGKGRRLIIQGADGCKEGLDIFFGFLEENEGAKCMMTLWGEVDKNPVDGGLVPGLAAQSRDAFRCTVREVSAHFLDLLRRDFNNAKSLTVFAPKMGDGLGMFSIQYQLDDISARLFMQTENADRYFDMFVPFHEREVMRRASEASPFISKKGGRL